MTQADTIFAMASGQGRAAVAVIRLSGPHSGEALRRLTGSLPAPRHATLTTLRHPETKQPLDQGLVLWFPAPQSFTGEDCAELQVHGSRAVVAAVLAALAALPGCRLAEAGEFTRRAFLNGKLDLSAVEGLADLIDAETEAQRRQALRQLDGDLGRWVHKLRETLIEILGWTEAAIDFADEGDIGTDAFATAQAEADSVACNIRSELERPISGDRIRDGFVVTLAGPPNAGKSTLLNALARRDVAIVSPYAGTTRDPIEVDLDLGGYAVRLIDTAGLRDTADPVEQEGVARARARAEQADLVLWLEDTSAPAAPPPDRAYARLWRVGTKADHAVVGKAGRDLLISAETGAGLPELIALIETTVVTSLSGGETALVARLRHRTALETAAAAIERAAMAGQTPEIAAEELRSAATALGSITGRIDVEDVLGAIFARFCIGK